MKLLSGARPIRHAIALRLLAAATATATVAALAVATPAQAFLLQPKSGPTYPAGVVVGPDGNFWVADEYSNAVVRMSPSGALIDSIPVGPDPIGIATGPGGRVWVALTGGGVAGAGKLVWFDATSPSPTAHDVSLDLGAGTCGPRGIVAGGDGRIYFSVPTQYFIPPSYDVPCSGNDFLGSVRADTGGAIASDLVKDPAEGGNVLDLAVAGGKLFAPDVDSGVVRRFPLGSFIPDSRISTSADTYPNAIAADAAGNLWVAESTYPGGGALGPGKLASFPASQLDGNVREYTPSGGTIYDPSAIVAGADGRVYAVGHDASGANGVILRFSPGDGSFAFYGVPRSGLLLDIVNGSDGELWISDQSQSRLLRLINTAPRATTGAVIATAATTASLAATIDPRGNDTQVVFDYGPTTAYGATSAPVTIPNGADPVLVSIALTGLTPLTTYHVRARAISPEGSAAGADTMFATPVGDADGDGVSPPRDCDDHNPAIRPGAVDKPGNKIDEDCSGADATYPELVATTNFVYGYFARYAIVRQIVISRLHGGETATLRCSGRRCPFKSKTYTKLKKGKRVFGKSLLHGRKLPVGSVMSVRVTEPGAVGTSTALTVRARKAPKISRACLQPGATKPSPCP